jgi:hypothetical protein
MKSLDFRLFLTLTPTISSLEKVRNLQNMITSTINVPEINANFKE